MNKPAAKPEEAGDLPFEAAMKELEEIVRRLESGGGDLDGAIRDYERGMQLKQHCQKKLEQATLKIEAVVKRESGIALQPFETQN